MPEGRSGTWSAEPGVRTTGEVTARAARSRSTTSDGAPDPHGAGVRVRLKGFGNGGAAAATNGETTAEAQSMVVSVQAPAKVFGDIHGQLRDLLALFARYGFPTHRGGDVEAVSYVFNG